MLGATSETMTQDLLTPSALREEIFARVRRSWKPAPAVFTQKLPDDLDSNTHFIFFIMFLLKMFGFKPLEGVPEAANKILHRALALDFITVMKVERPDMVYTLYQESLSISSTPTPAPPVQTDTRTQFHHYIPRFILKTFADNFSLDSSAAYITDTSSPDLSGFEKGKLVRSKAKKKGKNRPTNYINLYQIQDHSMTLADVARSYGVNDMYRDISEDDCMKFEKLLAKHECTSSTFIRQVWDGSELSLTRAQLADMKRFLVIMSYRSGHRRSQYFDQQFDPLTEHSIRQHMEHNNISSIQAVWFENLKWIISASPEDVLKEYNKSIKTSAKSEKFNPIFSSYQGPIHFIELADFACMMVHSIACIWEAEEGSEFVLFEGCFGAFEGDFGIQFHRFFVISPKYAIVLVNRLYLERANVNPSWKSMFGDELHAFPETVYKNEPLPKNFKPEIDFTPEDVFNYKRIVIPKEEVYKVNSISLDAEPQLLTYKSSVSMYKTLRYYDKVKEKLFHNHLDYSALRRKLFSDLNRTHSVEQ